MATYSSILAWRFPWTEELGGLQSMGVPKEWDMAEAIEYAHPGYCDCHPGNVTP